MRDFLLALFASVLIHGPTSAADPVPPHDALEIDSQLVGETRVVNVWKPPAYDGSHARYPVLYMPDGGIEEDFPHIVGTVAGLVERGAISPVLVVGIENTERRRDLTGPSSVAADAEIAPVSDGAKSFRAFIRDELLPEIDRRYRTTGMRAIVGESAAGLFVVETLLLAPDTFDVYIAMDPAVYWNDAFLVRNAPTLLAKLGDAPRRLWFAASGNDWIGPPSAALAAEIERHAPASLTWRWSARPKERHDTIFRATKEEALTWALGSPDDD